TWEAGVYDYKKLPKEGAIEHFDDRSIASYSYSPSHHELITYDTPKVITHKTKYIKDKCLRGVMFWELSSDHPTSNDRSLLLASFNGLGGKCELDKCPNHLSYPTSIYENVRKNLDLIEQPTSYPSYPKSINENENDGKNSDLIKMPTMPTESATTDVIYPKTSIPPATKMTEHGKVISAYFTSWSIYARKFFVQNIDYDKLTHILYAFANIKNDGEVFLGDPWSDTDIHFDGDSWNDNVKNLYGNFKQLYLLKKKNRHLKVSLSIGGWTWSTNFSAVASSHNSREKFVDSAIKLMNDLGLDGLD
ncbi:5449_t:CDS:2, partial [Entrophospora sp. SA101]